MEGLLGDMARSSVARAEAALREHSLSTWRERALAMPPAPELRTGNFGLVCEVKFASPSEGLLREGSADEAVRRARDYAAAGAAAISVLTEPSRFGGSLDHLARIASALSQAGVPAMRKDFLVDPVQLYEARCAGAGGVLLITRMLPDEPFVELLELTHELGMFALVEVFDSEDVERTRSALTRMKSSGATLVGVNSRNLVTLEVEPERLHELAPTLPSGLPAVAESGLETADDASALAGAGYELALVGTALMRAEDPAALARDMIAAGRRAHAGRGVRR